jgi:hypothetical protein
MAASIPKTATPASDITLKDARRQYATTVSPQPRTVRAAIQGATRKQNQGRERC